MAHRLTLQTAVGGEADVFAFIDNYNYSIFYYLERASELQGLDKSKRAPSP